MDSCTLTGELLTRHSGFLRALARGLLGDEQLAEDACQEALLAALRRPPPAHVNPVAWLATLTRRASNGILRRATRREAREIAVARAEAQPSCVGVLARAEIMLRVAEAVVSLPEPYCATLLARYYEDLTPSAIAARERVPLSTVKSRITRGHALLRERLDRDLNGERGHWEADLAALCGLSRKPLLLAATAMKTSVKVGLIVAALLAVVSTAWLVLDPEVPQAAPGALEIAAAESPLSQDEAANELASQPRPSPIAASARTGVLTGSELPPLTLGASTATDSNSSTVLLYGFAFPLPGTEFSEELKTVRMTDRLGKERRSNIGGKGEYSFPLVVSGRYWIYLGSQGEGEARCVIDVDAAGGDRRLDLQMENPKEILVEVVDGAGQPHLTTVTFAVATSQPPGEWIDEVAGNETYGFGAWTHAGQQGARYPAPVIGCLRLTKPPPMFVSLMNNQRVVATQHVEAGQTRVRFLIDPQAKSLQKGSLRMRLVDARTRQSLSKIELQLIQGAGVHIGSTGADGTYSGRPMPGWMNVKSMNQDFENVDLMVHLEPGRETDLGDIALDSPVTISGRVADNAGNGLSRDVFPEVIEATPSIPSLRHVIRSGTRSKADGSFQISNLSRRRYGIRVKDPESPFRERPFGIACVVVDATGGSVEDVRVELVPGTPLLIRSDERWPLVRFDIVNALGAPILSSRLQGPEPRKILLAPGSYTIGVWAGGSKESARRAITIANDPVEVFLP
ncbi:MAG TPA: sigma-70 family RNA polymerase sigma factor [Planctomycetota bacterium]|nr:sigma-70 family RNA polymerase sigma factor [Planctomycetota bacterium]